MLIFLIFFDFFLLDLPEEDFNGGLRLQALTTEDRSVQDGRPLSGYVLY